MNSQHRDVISEIDVLRKEYNKFVAQRDAVAKQVNKEWGEFQDRITRAVNKNQEEWNEFKLANVRNIRETFEQYTHETNVKITDMLKRI